MVLRQIVVSVGALFVAINVHGSAAEALSMKECSAKYKAAEGGRHSRWHEVERFSQGAMRGGGNLGTDALGCAIASECTTAESDRCQAFSGAGRSRQRGIPWRCVAQGLALRSVEGKARMQTVPRTSYRANKATGGNGSLKWIEKGGGYCSEAPQTNALRGRPEAKGSRKIGPEV